MMATPLTRRATTTSKIMIDFFIWMLLMPQRYLAECKVLLTRTALGVGQAGEHWKQGSIDGLALHRMSQTALPENPFI
jgi:hypothetical protein